ncbi:MAG: hypothetical protein ACHQDE_01170, partial [Acidimicrobiia bacterium]
GNGGLLTKHAVGVYSCRPPVRALAPVSVQAELDDLPTRVAAPRHSGVVTVETYTVMHDREGNPERAFVLGLLDDDRRTLATTDDATLVAALLTADPLGCRAHVDAGALIGLD